MEDCDLPDYDSDGSDDVDGAVVGGGGGGGFGGDKKNGKRNQINNDIDAVSIAKPYHSTGNTTLYPRALRL